MTELQKVEFEILQSFVNVCELLQLRYYLVCGSALGAVKYGGFIPWDDDVDVAMPRSDYERFCECAKIYLPEHYFLQTYRTDSYTPCFYCKIRDTRTTYIEKSAADLNINHGVYIDVFPLDGYPKDEKKAMQLEKSKRFLKLKLACAYKSNQKQSFKAKLFLSLERILGFHLKTAKTAEKLEKLLSAWHIEDSKFWCNHGNWQGRLEYAPREQYGDGVMMKFEGLEVRVPELYDQYLTQKYGDWRADLPPEEQVGHHYYEILDLERPYTDYIKSVSRDGRKIKLKKR